MNYGEILAKAWKIFWKFKILWLVGALPYLLYSLIFIPLMLLNPAMGSLIPSYPTELFKQEWMIYLPILLMLVFTLVYLVMLFFANTANSVGVLQAEQGAERISLADLLHGTVKIFPKVLGLYAIFYSAAFGIETALFGCLFAAILTTMGMASICVTPFIFLTLPVLLFGYALAELSKSAIIVDNLGMVDGLKRGWAILKTNFWPVALMGLILYFGIYLLLMILSIPMYLFLFVPMFASAISENIEMMGQSVGFMTISTAVLMPLYMAVLGILYVYVRNAWTLMYMRLTQHSKEPVSIESLNA